MPERASRKGASRRGRSKPKQNFYARVMDEVERLDLERAAGVNGIDDEIALLRVEIKKAMVGGDVGNLRLLVDATNALERLIRTRYQITREQRKGLKEAITTVLKDVALPLGINIGATVIGKQIK
ncbi:MAG: hypothetical protein A2137_05000 [Chloroflexi bacterium RBG_16_58_8]|nr:MAG: hypothetical protein A2137_05000 [Chloroflexi bacterium RBG_16_58_8]